MGFLSIFNDFYTIIILKFRNEDRPYLTGGQSLLNLSPGLSYRPNINFLTSLIAYRAADPQSFMPYVQNIRTFMYLYEEVNIRPQDSFASCEENMKTPDVPGLVCKFFPMVLGPCVKENNYGYDRSEPCIILKINKVYGWVPDIVNKTMGQDPLLTCRGRNSMDKEGFGIIRYFPNVTIDGKVYGHFSNLYYPYIIQFAYRSPLVAVQFVNITRHSLFMISCYLLNVRQTAGPVTFEILVD
ncbi:Nkb-3p [Sparganum proliferum]